MAHSLEDVQAGTLETCVRTFRVDADSITLDTNMQQELNARSMHLSKIMALTKLKFDVTLTPAEIIASATIGDMAQLIYDKQ